MNVPELELEPKDINKTEILIKIAEILETSITCLESKPIDIVQSLNSIYLNSGDNLNNIKNNLNNFINLQEIAIEKIIEQPQNSIKSTEELVEQNANQIDGIINNLPPVTEKQFSLSNEDRRKLLKPISNNNKQDRKQLQHQQEENELQLNKNWEVILYGKN